MSAETTIDPAPAGSWIGLWSVVLVAGVAVVLIAQFLIDAWADSSDAAHWTQHALLFVGGLTTGASGLRLYQLGSRRP